MTGGCLLLLPLHISWPCLDPAEPPSEVSAWRAGAAGAGIDPARCVLKWSLRVKLSQLFLLVFDCETNSYFSPRGVDWCLPPLDFEIFFFYIPLLFPGCRPQGPLTERGYVGVWREQSSDVSTQPAIVWPEERLNQYRGVTGGWAFFFAVEIIWSFYFYASSEARKYVSVSVSLPYFQIWL